MSEEKKRILTLLQRLYAAIKSTNKNVSSMKEDNMVLLWENSAPGSAFAAQTIEMDLSDYNWVKIETKTHTGTSQEIGTNDFKCPGVGNTFVQTIRTNTGGSGWWHASREVTISKTGVTFGTGGFRYSVANNQSAGDGYAIPLRIWGIKKSYSVSLVKDVLPPENGGTGVTSLEELKSKLGVISGGGSGGSGGPLTLSDSRLLQTYLDLKNVELYSSDTEWTSGSKTIPGLSNYESILVYPWTNGFDGIKLDRVEYAGTVVYKGDKLFHKISGNDDEHTTVGFNLTVTSGDTVQITYKRGMHHTASASHGTAWDAGIKRIVGLEPTAAYAKQKLGITDTTIENGKVKFSPVTVENKVLLWENPKPSEAMAADTTVSVPGITSYDSYSIVFKTLYTEEHQTNEDMFRTSDQGGYLRAITSSARCRRYFNFSGVDAIKFSVCSYNDTTNNNYILPIAIYGIKDNPTVNIPSVDISSVGLGGDITLTDSRQMQKYLALKNKKLWSGDVWNSGTKTIPGISNYQILQCNFDLGNSSCALIRRGANKFVGGMNVGYPTWMADASIELVIEGDNATITWEWLSQKTNSANDAINTIYGPKEIIGLEPTEEYVKSQLELNDTAIENGTVKFKPVEVDNRVLLWENPNPRAQFTPQTVLLENMNDYDSIVIQHNHSDVSTRAGISFLDLATDTTTIMTQTDSSADATTYLVSRIVNVVDGGLAFEGGYYKVSNSTSAGTNLNKYCVPNRIFGVKNKLTVEIPEVDLNGMGPTVDPNKVITLHDYVVDEGTSGIWTYRKWNSGIAECWAERKQEVAAKSVVNCDAFNFPLVFTEVPTVNVGCTASGADLYRTHNLNGHTTTTSMRITYINNYTSAGPVVASIYVKGLWKTLDTAPKEVAAVKENTARLSIDMDGYEKRTLLWTNSSVTTAFAPQTLTFDGVYDELEVLFNYDVTYPDRTGNQRVIVDDNDETILNATWGGNVTRRVIAKIANGKTTLQIQKGVRYISTAGDSNSVCIPYKVYGIQNSSKLEGKVTGDNLTLDIGANAPADLNPDTLIPSGADLNTYVEPGSYLSQKKAISASLSNCPWTSTGFVLQVMETASKEYKQILICNGNNNRMYTRWFNPYTPKFGDWKPASTTVTKVWENASPTSSFAKQSITIDASPNDLITIIHEGGSSSTRATSGKGCHLYYDEYTTGWVHNHRTVTIGDNGAITFQYGWTHKGYSEADAQANDKCIPLAIYVTKGVL